MDSESKDSWATKEDAEKWAKAPLLSTYHTGYLLFRDKFHITLFSGDHEEELLFGLKIPIRSLLEVENAD